MAFRNAVSNVSKFQFDPAGGAWTGDRGDVLLEAHMVDSTLILPLLLIS